MHEDRHTDGDGYIAIPVRCSQRTAVDAILHDKRRYAIRNMGKQGNTACMTTLSLSLSLSLSLCVLCCDGHVYIFVVSPPGGWSTSAFQKTASDRICLQKSVALTEQTSQYAYRVTQKLTLRFLGWNYSFFWKVAQLRQYFIYSKWQGLNRWI